jgi:prepilin-type N-terminal cleavage/methylation domain-containing protein
MRTNNKHGFTLIELVISIALAMFVVTLILSTYTSLFKGVRLQARRADTVREMINLRHLMTKSLDSMESVIQVTQDKIMFTKKQQGDVEHIVSFHDSALFVDGKAIGAPMKQCTFSASDSATVDNRKCVEWECQLKYGGWVGGVVTANDRTGRK